MVTKLFRILRNVFIIDLALAVGIALLEATDNVPKKIKITLVASLALIMAHNYIALEYYKFIHSWLRKKLITYESVTLKTVARHISEKKSSFLGLVLCRGSTYALVLVSLAETAAKLINFKIKVNTLPINFS